MEQRDDIITKLLPKLSKIINEKYMISDTEIREMLYSRWRTNHRQWRVKVKGNEKMNLRRMKKNTQMVMVRYYNNIII